MPFGSLEFSSSALRSSARWTAALLLAASTGCSTAKPPADAQASAQPAAEQTVAPLVRNAEQSRDAGDFDTAIQAYADAFGRTPWNTKLKRALAVTHSERAASFRTKGTLEPAERDLRAALELYPDDQEFKHSLAVVLLERSARDTQPGKAEEYRSEAKALSPELPIPERMANPTVERELDLAFELIERGQLDAGIAELERIHREYPGQPSTSRLLAQALVRKGAELSERTNYREARGALDQAVALYAEIAPCTGERCSAEELRVAHYNRVVVYLNDGMRDEARAALEEAQAAGLRFPDLAEALAR